jgi:hypothetical protein
MWVAEGLAGACAQPASTIASAATDKAVFQVITPLLPPETFSIAWSRVKKSR